MSTRRPLIGITYTYKPDEAGQVNDNVAPYVRAVEEAGGEAVLLLNDLERVEQYRANLDGLIFSGGTDVDPERYGETKHPTTQLENPARDEFEISLAREARARGIPTLCVCRGLQVANVAFGGTLIQDLRSNFGERYTLHHQQVKEDGCERDDVLPGHDVTVEEGSALAQLVGTTRFATNSMHHQTARTIGEGLRPVAWTPDGVVEALDATFEHPFFFAVQWHPEELHGDRVSRALFSGLVAAGRNRPA